MDFYLKKLHSYLRMLGAYVGFSWRAQIQYRGAFITQAAAMFVNNCVWLLFWSFFFARFPVVKGWQINDVITMWAISASGFGLALSVFWNLMLLPSLITRGQIDSWLIYPRAVLPHLALGKMSATAWGDTLFGFFVYFAFVRPDFYHGILFCLLVLAVAVLFIGFQIMIGSIGFFVGNAEALAEQWFFSMITFSTYPGGLFDGWVKVILFTAIPAAFISSLSVEALRQLSLVDAALTLAGAFAVLGFGVCLFYLGLRRYESGNLMEMRS